MADLYDPRAVANLVLQARQSIGLETRHIELQKLVFFCHEAVLLKLRRRLVRGYFEAWRFGPVHPTIYKAFKKYGSGRILDSAQAVDIRTGQSTRIAEIAEQEIRIVIYHTVSSLAHLSAAQLVDRSHLPGGAWERTVNKAKTSIALGLRITDDVIVESAAHYMRGGARPVSLEEAPDEDAPFAADGSR